MAKVQKNSKKKVVLAYSGGLDTSIIIPWLIENYDCEVIAFAADLGQNDFPDAKALEQKALNTGASKCYVLDLRKEFLEDYVWPTVRAGARYENTYLLGTSFARPLIAKYQVKIAEKEGAYAVAHGATGKGNDQVRFELTYAAMNPKLEVIAPWKDPKWNIHSREDAIDYAQARGISLNGISKKKIYSEDGNLWHLSHEGGILEEPDKEHKYDMLKHTKTYEKAPSKPGYVTISFDKGNPVAIDGKKMGAVELLEYLNKIGGEHACGLLDIVENRLVGLKSRGVYETPGGSLLYKAHECLEQLVLDKETLFEKQKMSMTYANLVYNGQWFTPLRQAMDAFISETQKVVTGEVTLKLYKGNIIPAGIKSPYSLYDMELGGFSDVEMYDQKDATGFIRCYGLPMKTRALLLGKKTNVDFGGEAKLPKK
ncbi:MAG: argininosuccinate synthase [Fibrobacteraceae bacterium]|jgi:argininosuccinate synthase|nr:argininosuccinate synthase [Fibrobacteraceae bacterium]MBQ5610528.1 argininosuccinate synthase [Fibrobacteraceae bacterium]MEE1276900.1 argininosuccinate synthase [Fibrobacteraceae bacterium]